MKKRLLFLLLPIFLFASQPSLEVHNRPLLKLNGRMISLIDVQKKMNVYLYKNYPHAMENPGMLYQFYSNNWRPTLDEIINSELMLMEAEAKEMSVTEGEVNEEIQARYGPNIMANLSKIGLSLEEAHEIVRTDMIVQRVMWFNVHQKALQDVTPTVVKAAYAAYLVANPQTDQWEYQVLTIRGDNEKIAEKIADQAATLTADQPLETVIEKLQTQIAEEPEAPKLSLSDDYILRDNELSVEHRSVLTNLEIDTKSEPVAQLSRATGKNVWRIFHLKDHQVIKPTAFEDLNEHLKNQLLAERFQIHTQAFYKKLRNQYNLSEDHLNELIPETYVPFVMK